MSRKTLFWTRVEKCAVMLLKIEIGAEKRFDRAQAYSGFGAIHSPRFIRAVAQKLHDLRCRSYLDAIDSLAHLDSKSKYGKVEDYRCAALRSELFKKSLSWVVGELRDRRLDALAVRSLEKIDAEFEEQKHQQQPRLKDALSEFRQPAKRVEEKRECDVVVYIAPARSTAKREDPNLKHLQEQLGKPRPLRRADDRHHLDEMVAAAYAAAPWMREPLEWLWRHNIMLLDDPQSRIEIPPMLLVGAPGVGKTHFARMLCEALGLHHARIDMSARSSAFDLAGAEYLWATSSPGVPVRTLAASPHANPVIILDEIEKAGRGTSGGSPVHALLPLLQRETARAFLCPFLQSTVDLSWCGWIGTANDADLIPGPILDRVRVFHVNPPAGRDLLDLVRRTLEPVGAEAEVIEEVRQQIEAGRMSLRGLGRLSNDFRALQSQPVMH